jgi:hypothetical protein
LLVPQHRIKIEGTTSVLLNYLLAAPGTDMALLPVGHSAMINHGGSLDANVEVVWYDAILGTETDTETGTGTETGIDGGASQASRLAEADPEDLVGRDGQAVYFAYKALRPLFPGEELLLDYGEEWEWHWERYLRVLELWLELHGATDVTLAPQFRHPIHVAATFFPSNLMVSCVGLDCDKTSVKSHSREYHQMLLNVKTHSTMSMETVQQARKQSNNRTAFLEECSVTSASSISLRSFFEKIVVACITTYVCGVVCNIWGAMCESMFCGVL